MSSQGHPIKAVLCGDLNMLRCFTAGAARRAGLPYARIPIVTVSTDPRDLTFASRHAGERAFISDPASEPARVADELVRLGRRIGGRPALFYGTDAMLLCISRHREALSEVFRFLMPPAERVEELVDKTRFSSLAERLGLPVPRTLISREIRSAEDVLRRLPLPLVVKPCTHIGWFRSAPILAEGGLRRKALFATSEEELRLRLSQMRSFSGDFLIQTYVPGGDDAITSFHAYIDASGRPLACYVGKKIRTYPAGSGESTFIELVEDEDAERLGLSVVSALGIVGVVKLDFKRDARTGELLLLEANPRFCLWNYLGAASGINLPLFAYANLAGLPAPRKGPLRRGVRWLSFEGDLRAFIHGDGEGSDWTLPSWLSSYAGPKVYDVFAWDDPWPAAVGLFRRVEGKLRKMGFSS